MDNLTLLSLQKWELDCEGSAIARTHGKDYIAKTKFTDKTANGLTHAIITYLNLNGSQAERISNTGRLIDKSKVVDNVIGKVRIGTSKWIPGTGRNGTADISATIKGRSVKIEVKMKDKQSAAQIEYMNDVRSAGGVYWLVHNFNEFIEQYNSLVK